MALIDLSGENVPFTKTFPLATKDIAYPVKLPATAFKIIVSLDNAGKWAWSGTDGVILPASYAMASGTAYTLDKGTGELTWYVQTDANTKNLTISCMGA